MKIKEISKRFYCAPCVSDGHKDEREHSELRDNNSPVNILILECDKWYFMKI